MIFTHFCYHLQHHHQTLIPNLSKSIILHTTFDAHVVLIWTITMSFLQGLMPNVANVSK
jgi:hypothetical protein